VPDRHCDGAAKWQASPDYWSKRKKLMAKVSIICQTVKFSEVRSGHWYQEFTSTVMGNIRHGVSVLRGSSVKFPPIVSQQNKPTVDSQSHD
jgi:hypothetical protein